MNSNVFLSCMLLGVCVTMVYACATKADEQKDKAYNKITNFCSITKNPPPEGFFQMIAKMAQQNPPMWGPVLEWHARIMEGRKENCNEA